MKIINSVKLGDIQLIQKSVALLSIDNKLSERQIRKTIQYTIVLKRINDINNSLGFKLLNCSTSKMH